MRAYTSRLEGWTGIAVESPFSVARIKNISAQHPLTDKLVCQGEEPVSCGLARHDFLCGYERQCEIAVAGIQNPYACHRKRRNGMIAPEPDSVMGIKILEVDSLLDDESLSSVRAAFAEDFFRARRNSLALKN